MSEKLLDHKHNLNSKGIIHITNSLLQLKLSWIPVDLYRKAKWQFELLLMSKDLQEERDDEARDHMFYFSVRNWQCGRGSQRWKFPASLWLRGCYTAAHRGRPDEWLHPRASLWQYLLTAMLYKECNLSLFPSPLPPHGYIRKQYQGELWQWSSFILLPCWEVERNYSSSGLIHDLKSSVCLQRDVDYL